MQLRCAKCDKTLEVPDEAAGKKVRCPACMSTMVAPHLSAAPQTSSSFSASTGVPHPAEDHELPFAKPAPSGSQSQVHCPNCDRPLSLTKDVAGQIVACPACRKRMKMPLDVPAYPAVSSSYPTKHSPQTRNPYDAARRPAEVNPFSMGVPTQPSGIGGQNPYQTPIGATGQMHGGHSEPIMYILPGIFLAAIAGISVVISGARIFFGVLGGGNMQAPNAIVALLFFAVPLSVNLIIMAGGIQMARRRSLTFCRFASVLAIIPLFGFCCIGNTPFGIWAMIVLMMDNANRDFR